MNSTEMRALIVHYLGLGLGLNFNVSVQKVNELIKEKGVGDRETTEAMNEMLSMAKETRNRMRQLLNVDALG